MGPPPSNVMLIAAPEVQTELALTDAQKQRVGELQGEMQEQMRASFSGVNFQELGSLSEEERDKRFADMRTKSEAAMKQLDEKLNQGLDAKQITRLKQLALQRDVIAALNRPDVTKQLKLSKDQETKLRDIAGQGFPPFGPPDARPQAQADALAVLNETQKKQWTDLTGKSFTFPEPQFGGPGFGGPGGRGDAGEVQRDQRGLGRNAGQREGAGVRQPRRAAP